MPPYFEKSMSAREETRFPRRHPMVTERKPKRRDKSKIAGKELPESPAPSPAAALSRERPIPRKKDSEGESTSGSRLLACFAMSPVGAAMIFEKPSMVKRLALKNTGISGGRKGLRRTPKNRAADRIPVDKKVMMHAERAGIFT